VAQGDVLQLVQQYDQMRSGQLGNGGGGVGRPMEKPQGPQQQGLDDDGLPAGDGMPVDAPITRDALDLVEVVPGVEISQSIVPDLAEILDAVDGLKIVSAFRDERANQREGGVPHSRHLAGKAVDLRGTAKAMRDAAGYASSIGVPEVSLEGAHLHLGWD
jgi:hypothetical protein